MIRQTVRSMALAALGLALAGGAWGQTLRQSTSTEAMVAHEYFGAAGGREILASKFDVDPDTADQQAPYVGLGVAGAAIAEGNVADITFTLGGATFSSTVAPSNLDLRDTACGGTRQAGLSVSVGSGGAKGDVSVTFRVESTAALAVDAHICFWVPDLMATLTKVSAAGEMPEEMGVNVTASIAQVASNSSPFPGLVNGMDVDHDMDASTAAIAGPITDRTIFTAARALMASVGEGAVAMVNIDDRTKIASGGMPDPSAADPSKAMMGVLVGELTVDPSSDAATTWKLDGSGYVATSSTSGGAVDTLDASLGGRVKLSVAGPFHADDKVVFGSGDSAREEKVADGMARAEVDIELGASTMIVYVPGGSGILKPSEFTATAEYAFNSSANNNDLPILSDAGGKASIGQITYAGITVEGYAYGVVRGGGTENSVVRATCEAPAGKCSVFLDCTSQDGMNYFGGPAMVDAGATARWDSDDIRGVLEDGWDMGRGRCELWSDAPLAVQHMVRGGGLINNSAVVGRSLDEGTDDAIAAVRMVVDDICDSIGTNDGAGANVIDTVCVAVDTVAEP